MHTFEPSALPRDYYGRAYCGLCGLPGRPDDARHSQPPVEPFRTFAEASQPPEREEVTR